MKWQVTVLGSNFAISGLNTFALAGLPQTLKCRREGTFPVHNSYGVLGTDLLGTLLRI